MTSARLFVHFRDLITTQTGVVSLQGNREDGSICSATSVIGGMEMLGKFCHDVAMAKNICGHFRDRVETACVGK